jgi:hypothetical protein
MTRLLTSARQPHDFREMPTARIFLPWDTNATYSERLLEKLRCVTWSGYDPTTEPLAPDSTDCQRSFGVKAYERR